MKPIDYAFQLFVSFVCGVAGWGIGQAWRLRDLRKELILAAGTGRAVEIGCHFFLIFEAEKNDRIERLERDILNCKENQND